MMCAHLKPGIMHKCDGEHVHSGYMKGASYGAWLRLSPVFFFPKLSAVKHQGLALCFCRETFGQG